MIKSAQEKNLELSPSPFHVLPHEIAGLVSQAEINDFRMDCGYDRLGQTHARADDVKRVILAKLLHRSPTCNMSIAEAAQDLVDMWLTLWALRNPNIFSEVQLPDKVYNVDRYLRTVVGGAAKDALYDLLDDAARTAEGFVRYRVYSFGPDTQDNLERVEGAHRTLETYKVSELSLLDFDIEQNEHAISLMKQANDSRRERKLDPHEYFIPSEEYNEQIEEELLESEIYLESSDEHEPGSNEYKSALYTAAHKIRKAIAICGVAQHYYDGLRAENAEQKQRFQSLVLEFKQRANKLQSELGSIKDFSVMYDGTSESIEVTANWYRIAQNKKTYIPRKKKTLVLGMKHPKNCKAMF